MMSVMERASQTLVQSAEGVPVLDVNDRSCWADQVCRLGVRRAALGSGRTCRKTEMRHETEHGTLRETARSVPTEARATQGKD